MFVDKVTDCTFSVLSSMRCWSFFIEKLAVSSRLCSFLFLPQELSNAIRQPRTFFIETDDRIRSGAGGSQKLRWRDQLYSMTNGFRVPCSSEDLT